MTIRTFKCADTEALFHLRRVARFANIERSALRKLKQLDLARRIEDLRAPPAPGGRPNSPTRGHPKLLHLIAHNGA